MEFLQDAFSDLELRLLDRRLVFSLILNLVAVPIGNWPPLAQLHFLIMSILKDEGRTMP